MEVLRLVMEREPTPPAALNPRVDRDLQTMNRSATLNVHGENEPPRTALDRAHEPGGAGVLAGESRPLFKPAGETPALPEWFTEGKLPEDSL